MTKCGGWILLLYKTTATQHTIFQIDSKLKSRHWLPNPEPLPSHLEVSNCSMLTTKHYWVIFIFIRTQNVHAEMFKLARWMHKHVHKGTISRVSRKQGILINISRFCFKLIIYCFFSLDTNEMLQCFTKWSQPIQQMYLKMYIKWI